jgi:tetratricopeptide (TPR) repeat protein
MTAFLSHSSKDKHFVGQVASAMNPLEYELDERTFDYTMNVQAIRQALQRADLVVFFLSTNSLSSSFVREEERQALEARGRGTVRQVIVFSIDGTSHKELPEWLREVNLVQNVSSPKACARRIQAMLLELSVQGEPELLYLGRENDEKELRRVLSAPASKTPVALHIVGFHGIGRRTFLRTSLKKLFPRLYSVFIEISASQYQGIEEFYRGVYRLHFVASMQEQIEKFANFAGLPSTDQIREVSEIINKMASQGEFIVVFDEGNAVFDDSGDLHTHWAELIAALEPIQRPVLAFVQTRMQPYRLRDKYPRDYHQRVDAIGESDVREIISFSLKERNIEFTESQVNEIGKIVDGHPYNIRFAVGLASHYGIDPFLRDPSQFIEWRNKRGEDFLGRIEFDDIETDIIAYLIDYRYLATDALLALVELDAETVIESVRTLQDFCCVEFRDGFFHLAAPIREAARRDPRFQRADEWRRTAASKIIEVIGQYREEDHIPLNLLETATVAAVRGGGAPPYLRLLILPSHLLIIAREHYDGGRRAQCIEVCKQAFELSARMTGDAQVETLRLWALSAARLGERGEYEHAITQLRAYSGTSARRVRLFVEGLKARLDGRPDVAEDRFLQAWRISETNASVNRELAQLYCRQRRYVDAEKYARASYATSPTNPYVLDIMLEMLLGKKGQGQHADDKEILNITEQLKTHGNEPGFSFFLVREAQRLINHREYPRAISVSDEAISQTPNLPSPYFLKFEAQLRAGFIGPAEATLKQIVELLDLAGASEGDDTNVAEAEANLLLEKRQYDAAKQKIESDRRLPAKVVTRLLNTLAKAISFDPDNATVSLRSWAKQRKGI